MTFLQTKVKLNQHGSTRLLAKLLVYSLVLVVGLTSCGTPSVESTPIIVISSTPPFVETSEPIQTPEPASQAEEAPVVENSRGYLTTPQELREIAAKAGQGIEPYESAVEEVIEYADQEWDFKFKARENCSNADKPAWNDNGGGTPILYAKALAFHLTGDSQYAEDVKVILESIMTEVESINIDTNRCRLVFGWGTPELVASADLIEDYWQDKTCTGPTGTEYLDTEKGTGRCKELFQNWLVKNPYYVVSLSAESSKSNWGAAATNTLAYIADYLWDRPDMVLIHRYPPQINEGKEVTFTPAEAFEYANKLALDRMNGYGVEYGSSTSCDSLSGSQQKSQWPAVKSQISELGIIPEDARREQYCNIPEYNGEYQNYPQIHLGNNIQQCELMLRRGDPSCFDNVDNSDVPEYTFIGPDGNSKTTHLYPGRGSIERAIKAIIVDSSTEWRHDSALEVAFRYYFTNNTLPGFEEWADQLNGQPHGCSQDICFGTLTHGFAIEEETPGLPPTVSPP